MIDIDRINREENLRKKYELVIDCISDYLINNENMYDICDFQNDMCIANRLNKSVNKCNGCCYHIRKGLCEYLVNKKCMIDCISCKLFRCNYLENKYGKINLNDIIPFKKIFNRKQREIIRRSFFKDKSEIIDLLLKYK